MPLIDHIIRPDIRSMSAYHIPDSTGFVKLDAMENPYALPDYLRTELGMRLSGVALNRYPAPSCISLKEKICTKLGVADGFDVLLGNGSDELISMIAVACAKPGAKVLAPAPGFVMYALSAQFAGMEFIGISLRKDLTLDTDAMLAAIALHQPSLIYLAYPNNPTGTLYDTGDMVKIIHAAGDSCLVIVDEAYQPFAQTTFMPRLPEFANLIVMRTLSKLGLAGIRLGYMAASKSLLNEFDKVRPPYNINVLTQATAEFMLDHLDVLDAQAGLIRAERAALIAALTTLSGVKVFPSMANFVLIRVQNSEQIVASLRERRVLIKNVGKMHALLKDCLRVTVGTPEENALFLGALQASLEA